MGMAHVPIRKFDDKLPHARLYLDDLKEIEELYRAAIKQIEPEGSCKFHYEIRGEMRFESLQDLEEHGGYASPFDMYMTLTDPRGRRDYSTPILRMWGWVKSEMSTPYQMLSRQWDLRAKLLAIFAPRRDRLKILVDSVGPVWLNVSIWVFLIAVIFFSRRWGTNRSLFSARWFWPLHCRESRFYFGHVQMGFSCTTCGRFRRNGRRTDRICFKRLAL
jgi:hypothetical protein